ncbi:hypothetical protein [uncultured Microbulbifer sp.]|uniref:hypothetical protein n=1 Tax=uncultured Microbulbifer sp. TaxID=348147 RepID=UPI002620322F|nr:hypothetical protein [uncultured Microbulbifer sp.]
MDGHLHRFKSLYEAQEWLLEDEFVSFASLDVDDEKEYEITLSKIVTPSAECEEEVVKLMYVPANA